MDTDEKVELAADMMLDLTADLTKLCIVLGEIPEEELHKLAYRFGILLEAVDSLPLDEPDPANWGKNSTGEA